MITFGKVYKLRLGASRMTMDDIFSERNMMAYAGACIDLAVSIPERQKITGFDTLIIPSRGALPFFLGVAHALEDLSLFGSEQKNFRDNLGVQPVLAPLLPEDSQISPNVDGKKIRVLLAPFTADLNIEKFDPTTNNTDYTTRTRDYWAKVTAAFFQPPQSRREDPYFRSFVDTVLRGIEGRDEVASGYEAFPEIQSGFSMVDTVISGRAANDILRSFDRLSEVRQDPRLRPTAFLVVDNGGSKLRSKPPFFAYLNQRKVWGEVELFEMPRIVSEDEGASLLGISAVVYPSVMRASNALEVAVVEKGENVRREFFVGAGSWYLAPDLRSADSNDCDKNFNWFMDVVYKAIDAKFAAEYEGVAGSDEMMQFRGAREEFVRHAERIKILSLHEQDVSALKLSSRYKPEPKGVYETHSHVLHIPFSNRTTGAIVKDLLSIPGVSYRRDNPKV